ncbi:MAG: inorganic phosphate transporter [Bacteroidales bacterium]|nr:inorganic phosphate transporter [Bacteroidales bacterium]
MDSIYLIIVVILFALAISDLIVGVSNDAVNFLNSAIGAKAAPFKVIMIVAALGILVGAMFSSGLMEVARKGIFHPEHFYFSEIMIIFLAVMITDIILLDAFNTVGLPTSTTVSIVFELLGAAVAVSLIKISSSSEVSQDMSTYINYGKAMAIISGILLSIVIAFSIGAIVQWITRLIFSFNYKKNLRYFGAIWGGLAITAITYFMLIKGAKGSSFMTPDNLAWIKENTFRILLLSFIGWTVIFQLLNSLINFNILKLVVLVGTFALAMAFAGNDLVNFIGVPLAGFESYKAFVADPASDPNSFLMIALTEKVKTPTLYLLIAGTIMVVTLWTSKKARSVLETTLDLARQDVGEERFGSTYFSRSLVRSTRNLHGAIHKFIPVPVKARIDRQFDHALAEKPGDVRFDMIRASVNLVVASILIAIGTSLKLPLSTTYVTFMVAMGTSLSDRAWGRESAVYRITGVLSVISGWFFTAFSAFTAAFIVAWLIHWGGFIAIVILILLALFIVVKTRITHRKKAKEKEKKVREEELTLELEDEDVLRNCTVNVTNILSEILGAYNKTFDGLTQENLKDLKKASKSIKTLTLQSKELKDNINKTIKKLREDSIETGYFYVQVLDYLREIIHSIYYISQPSLEHIANNLKPLTEEQIIELITIKDELNDLFSSILQVIIDGKFKDINIILQKQQTLLDLIQTSNRNQLKRIKNAESGTKNSLLYLNILSETKNLILYAINLLKSQRDFAQYQDNKKNNK